MNDTGSKYQCTESVARASKLENENEETCIGFSGLFALVPGPSPRNDGSSPLFAVAGGLQSGPGGGARRVPGEVLSFPKAGTGDSGEAAVRRLRPAEGRGIERNEIRRNRQRPELRQNSKDHSERGGRRTAPHSRDDSSARRRRG